MLTPHSRYRPPIPSHAPPSAPLPFNNPNVLSTQQDASRQAVSGRGSEGTQYSQQSPSTNSVRSSPLQSLRRSLSRGQSRGHSHSRGHSFAQPHVYPEFTGQDPLPPPPPPPHGATVPSPSRVGAALAHHASRGASPMTVRKRFNRWSPEMVEAYWMGWDDAMSKMADDQAHRDGVAQEGRNARTDGYRHSALSLSVPGAHHPPHQDALPSPTSYGARPPHQSHASSSTGSGGSTSSSYAAPTGRSHSQAHLDMLLDEYAFAGSSTREGVRRRTWTHPNPGFYPPLMPKPVPRPPTHLNRRVHPPPHPKSQAEFTIYDRSPPGNPQPGLPGAPGVQEQGRTYGGPHVDVAHRHPAQPHQPHPYTGSPALPARALPRYSIPSPAEAVSEPAIYHPRAAPHPAYYGSSSPPPGPGGARHGSASGSATGSRGGSITGGIQYQMGLQRPPQRKRQLISCYPCRKRKLRCDGGRPVCQQCQRRNIHGQCGYAETVKRRGRGKRVDDEEGEGEGGEAAGDHEGEGAGEGTGDDGEGAGGEGSGSEEEDAGEGEGEGKDRSWRGRRRAGSAAASASANAASGGDVRRGSESTGRYEQMSGGRVGRHGSYGGEEMSPQSVKPKAYAAGGGQARRVKLERSLSTSMSDDEAYSRRRGR
ncbi:hypothetical protein IAT38_000506 [Cryptococcus sp. DSM 104549]